DRKNDYHDNKQHTEQKYRYPLPAHRSDPLLLPSHVSSNSDVLHGLARQCFSCVTSSSSEPAPLLRLGYALPSGFYCIHCRRGLLQYRLRLLTITRWRRTGRLFDEQPQAQRLPVIRILKQIAARWEGGSGASVD